MQKFKIGDKVRYTKRSLRFHSSRDITKIHTITSFSKQQNRDSPIYIRIDGNAGGDTGDFFELVVPKKVTLGSLMKARNAKV